MSILKLKKREKLEILFGVKLPLIIKKLSNEIKNNEKIENIIKNTFNIKKNRLIKLMDVEDNKGIQSLLLVIYDNFPDEREKRKLDLKINEFNFNVYEFDYNKIIDIELIINNIKTKF